MNAYNPIATLQRLEASGFDRRQAEALATELRETTMQLVTQEQLQAALDRQTIRICGAMAAMLALAVTASKIFA